MLLGAGALLMFGIDGVPPRLECRRKLFWMRGVGPMSARQPLTHHPRPNPPHRLVAPWSLCILHPSNPEGRLSQHRAPCPHQTTETGAKCSPPGAMEALRYLPRYAIRHQPRNQRGVVAPFKKALRHPESPSQGHASFSGYLFPPSETSDQHQTVERPVQPQTDLPSVGPGNQPRPFDTLSLHTPVEHSGILIQSSSGQPKAPDPIILQA